MEPNKFEQEIREKLESRSINPSPMAWDRLDAMLTVAEGGTQKAAKKHNRSWMYMAACFLFMLSVGGFLLLHNDNKDTSIPGTTNSVVNNGQSIFGTKTQTGTNTTTNILPQTQQQGHAASQQGFAGTQKSSSSASKNNQHHQTGTGTIQHISPGFDPIEPVAPEMAAQTTPTLKVKVDAGALLTSVQTKKPQAAKATQPGVKVNANALLTGIEGEMELNFRDRMFDKLAKGYDEVKEAVVTRNYN